MLTNVISTKNMQLILYACRKEFVEQYVSYIFDKSVEEQFAAFNTGFHKVCGGRVLVRILL